MKIDLHQLEELYKILKNPQKISINGDEKTATPVPQPAADHRQITPGGIFFAIPGNTQDGKEFITEAIKNGANHIVIPDDISTQQLEKIYTQVKEITLTQNDKSQKNIQEIKIYKTTNIRKLYAEFCKKIYTQQPEKVVAITGTNGKTSTSHFYACIAAACIKETTYYLGTMGIIQCQLDKSEKIVRTITYKDNYNLTTPDPKIIHKTLNEISSGTDCAKYVAMEASSHGLDQHRIDYVKFSATAFTNLSHDHLDYHSNMEQYFAAKLRLFTEFDSKYLVLNADSEYAARIADTVLSKEHTDREIIFYTTNTSSDKSNAVTNITTQITSNSRFNNKILKLTKNVPGQGFNLEYQGKEYFCQTDIICKFQISNLLCAIALFLATAPKSIILDDILDAIKTIPSPRGRMERIGKSKIYVDYSHTPEALELVLMELRESSPSKLWVVFGCGGDRDKSKRKKMGEIAFKIADMIVITDDNPRNEDPQNIRSEIIGDYLHHQENNPQYSPNRIKEIGDRRKAIEYAISNMEDDDVVLIAGKGHEKYQIIKNEVIPMCDIEIATFALKEREKMANFLPPKNSV